MIVKISREEVLRVAELAHLELSADEVETYRGQLDSILAYIDKLKALDVSRVEPMAQVLFKAGSGDQNTVATSVNAHTDTHAEGTAEHPELRDDRIVPCGTAAELFGQAPSAAKPFFRVPKVIER